MINYLNKYKLVLSFLFLAVSSISCLSLNNIYFGSAGVLTRVKIGKEWHLILAREVCGPKKGTYDCFAGKRDQGEKPFETAFREFREESSGVFTNSEAKCMTSKAKAIIAKLSSQNNNVSGVLYLVDLDLSQFAKLKNNFYKNLKNSKLNHVFKEKDKLALIKESDFIKALKNCHNRHQFFVDAQVLESNLKTKKAIIQIYPFLIKMLKNYYNNNNNYLKDSSNKLVKFYK